MRDMQPLEGAVWLRRHAVADGFSDTDIARLVRAKQWHRVRRGAFASGDLWRSLSPEDRHRLLCRAVLLTAHPSSVLSHVSAAVEWGADTWDLDLGQVHLTRTDGKSGRREAGLVHHRGALTEDQVTVINGVRVTAAPRAVVETCTITDVEHGLVVTNSLFHEGKTSPKESHDEAHASRFWPGSSTTDLVLRLADPRIESPLESRAFYLLWSQHLPRPELQVHVHDESGRLVGSADFAWPERGVFVETDGRFKYRYLRREGESLEDFLLREKRREELICQLTGWICIRIMWEDLAHPQVLARRIRKVMESRAAYSA